MQLLKGSSSHWINANDVLPGNSRGEEATVRSLFRKAMLAGCGYIAAKRNITVSAGSLRSSGLH